MFFDRKYTTDCHIYNMLETAPRHMSFHTPGHKAGKWDITELSFSDNLADPKGVILRAQDDIACILGARKSFILTDGSTSGVLSMMHAARPQKLLFATAAHESVYNACRLFSIEEVTIPNRTVGIIPQQPTATEIESALEREKCDGVLLTSPDYYGNIADYEQIKAVCHRHGAILICDGAHGAHLHGTNKYAGNFCDMWVDGVHKSLPAMTQGAVVSAKTEEFSDRLEESVSLFRTTSPNYLIMASVEYAVKYPRMPKKEKKSEEIKRKYGAYENADWSKIVLFYGKDAKKACAYIEGMGLYPEFCDGENILFYLSPATPYRQLCILEKTLAGMGPMLKKAQSEVCLPGEKVKIERETEMISLEDGEGRVSAANAGLFPPCVPVISCGKTISKEDIERLKEAGSTYGMRDGKICVYVRTE